MPFDSHLLRITHFSKNFYTCKDHYPLDFSPYSILNIELDRRDSALSELLLNTEITLF